MSDDPILRFEGRHRFLSNFFPSPIAGADGAIYPTVEHAFQAAKTADENARRMIREASTPGEAKRLGRRVKLQPDWDDARIGVMFILLLRKFDPGSELAERLLATGDAHLEEGNTWGDRVWGVCGGEGSNFLGILLMGVRESLKKNLRNALLDLEWACDELTETLRGGS